MRRCISALVCRISSLNTRSHCHLSIAQQLLLSNNQSIKQTTTDVLQSEDSPNKFFFYEVYENADAIAHHKLQPHYLAWGEFKESGGTVSSVSKKAGGIFMT